MKVLLSIFFVVIAVSVSAQKYHTCSVYRYEGGNSLLKELDQRMHYNDKGKIILEEGYFAFSPRLKKSSPLVEKVEYFYLDDTLLWKSECHQNNKFFSDVHNKWIDSMSPTIRFFHYNNAKQILNDTAFKCGEFSILYGDTWDGDTLTCDTSATQYFYDALGNKIQEQNTHIFLNTTTVIRHTWMYTDGKVTEEDEYELVTYKGGGMYLGGDWEASDKQELHRSKTINTYSGDDLIEQIEYKYPSRHTNQSIGADTSKEVHNYTAIDNKIVKEEINHQNSGPNSESHYTQIISYDYYPDKRLTMSRSVYARDDGDIVITKIYDYK